MHAVAAHEAGVVTAPGDLRVHAIRKTLHGRKAVCGAGPVLGLLPGRFDEVEENVCADCLTLAAASQRQAG
jgi:hypothetical protein